MLMEREIKTQARPVQKPVLCPKCQRGRLFNSTARGLSMIVMIADDTSNERLCYIKCPCCGCSVGVDYRKRYSRAQNQ